MFNFFKKKKDTSTFVTNLNKRPQFIISGDLNITLVLNGETHAIGTSHANHKQILEALKSEDWKALPELVDISVMLSSFIEGDVEVNEFGEVFYNGEQVHNTISDRILAFVMAGEDFKPLARFLNNLMQNPSRRAVEELYTFLQNEGMAITEDGCFVGYKGIRNDWKDIYSGKFDNSPGQVLEMQRNLVDDDARMSCSNGFHVGSQRYASSWSNDVERVVLVKVNPRDAVSVPYDGGQKLRTCRYEVLREVEKSTLIETPMYRDGDLDQEDPEEDNCEFCGETDQFCVCDDYTFRI